MTSDSSSLYQIELAIRSALEVPLPGEAAHLRLAPRPRHGWRPGHVPPGARAAAGLVLLYPRQERPHLLLTVRAGALVMHAGQVSFPGGRVEDNETVQQAALREAAEEVGVEPVHVDVLGVLSTLYIPVSDFALHPIVAVMHRAPSLRAQTDEVGRILEVPIASLLDPLAPRRGVGWRRDGTFQIPYLEVCDERVWGATAMILAELLALLGHPPADPWSIDPPLANAMR